LKEEIIWIDDYLGYHGKLKKFDEATLSLKVKHELIHSENRIAIKNQLKLL